jgi:predicted molibdopterin-dependent oxidoreductase YjgC
VTGAPRGPFCLMGVCFECLVEIDGRSNCCACMTQVAPGMRIVTQRGPPP